MSRPLYETSNDLSNEHNVALFLQDAWHCKLTKMPIRYHLDYVITKEGDTAVGFCEIKTRNYSMDDITKMGGYLMSIGKWSSAKQLYDCSGLPFFLAVRTLDGIWYSKFTDFKPSSVSVRGRTDRGDWQDIEPCVLLDTSMFKQIYTHTSLRI